MGFICQHSQLFTFRNSYELNIVGNEIDLFCETCTQQRKNEYMRVKACLFSKNLPDPPVAGGNFKFNGKVSSFVKQGSCVVGISSVMRVCV